MSFSSTRPKHSSPSASNRAVFDSRAVFFAASALAYATAIVLAILTLNPYFSQTWDVNTFIHAAHRFLDGGSPFDLYAQSRAAQTWPYAYPPLHAFVVAIALFVGNLTRALPGVPEYVWARVPVILADIGVAFVLHGIVRRKANDETIARVAALLWLFNPVTFYDTAVQGHFESEWLLFVLLAYAWFENSRHIALPTIALAVAVLFKQVAILFAIPVWMCILVETLHATSLPKRAARFVASGLMFALVAGIVCLPFLLYSDDFLYMNLPYVENVPVQTQSWIVALLGITRASPNALTSDFFLLRYQTVVTMLAAVVIAFFSARRGWSLYLTATLIALAFFLTSKKVMGYYYVMLFPFLFAEVLPKRRFDLALTAIVATMWISLSPYYAAWVDHTHWWIYAVSGVLNSVFLVWLFWRATADDRRPTAVPPVVSGLRSVVVISLGLFASAVFASLLQPFSPNNGSPIRAPIIVPGTEANVAIAFSALVASVVVTLAVVARATRDGGTLPRAVWGVVLIFAPLFFSVYTLTKESTAIFEIALKALGV